VSVRVLIVDDSHAFREAARRVVMRLPGFEVVGEADSGEAAIELSRRLTPDLILMDVHLPGMDGMEATRRVLADAENAQPVILLLSTYAAVDYAAPAAESGATAYLPKGDFGVAALRAIWDAACAANA
jgi:two-component system, NarL family, invasion response regulator UvrY